MAIIAVKKVYITALRRESEALGVLLQRLGVMHVDELHDEAGERPGDEAAFLQAGEELRRLGEAIELLGRHGQKKKKTAAEELSLESFGEAAAQEAQMQRYLQQIRSIEEEIAAQKAVQARLDARAEQLLPYAGLDVRAEDLTETDAVFISAGACPSAGINELKNRFEQLETAHLDVFLTDRDLAYLFVVCHKNEVQEMRKLLSQFGYTRAPFEGVQGTPQQAVDALKAQWTAAEETQQAAQQKLSALAEEALEPLKRYYDARMLQYARMTELRKTLDTRHTVTMMGYIPAKAEEKLSKELAAFSENVFLRIEDIAEDEDAPILLENKPLMDPFASVTEMYALPRRDEIDPTALLGIFYFIFFGMMVSDAVYGLLMTLGCGTIWIMKKKKTPRLIRLLTYAGISTTVWGVMFGSYFGESFFPPVLLSPMDDPLTMLIVCFAMGFVQILVGLGTKFYINVRNGDPWAGVMDQLSWIVMLLGVLVLLIPGAQTVAWIMIILGAVTIVATNGRDNKSIVGRIGMGLYSLYGVTSYLSDILSYSRLFALGIATGVIGMVINSICEVAASFGFVGKIVAAVVFLGGHLFNIGINVLGAYVHDARLQFVEFFGKFYEGGGRPFSAFAAKTKYHPVKADGDK